MPSPNLWVRDDADLPVVAAGRACHEDLRAEPVFPLPLEGDMWRVLAIDIGQPVSGQGILNEATALYS